MNKEKKSTRGAGKLKHEPPSLRVRITTNRGPFWQGRPLAEGEVAVVSRELAQVLIERRWAEKSGGEDE